MKLRLSEKDIELLSFLKKYKIMYAKDSKRIYKSIDYHNKRLKVLEKEQYIKRVDRYYIKLGVKGLKLMRDIGYDYNNICRRADYQNRVKEIAKIATLALDCSIEFMASWEIKSKTDFTEVGRKYIGKLKYQKQDYLAYYISKDKEKIYIRQIINDIQKTINNKKILIFIEKLNPVNKNNQYFMFGKEATIIVKASKENLEKMRLFEKIDLFEIIKQVYKEKEILLSDWDKADYMTEDKDYIILMPFIDTEKLHKLNVFYNNDKKILKKINILTLRENKELISEILTNSTNIIEIDELLGGIDEELEKR